MTKDSKVDLSPVAKRNVAIANALAYAYASALAKANANANANANAIANAIAKALALAYANALAKAIANAKAKANAIAIVNAHTSPYDYPLVLVNAFALVNAYVYADANVLAKSIGYFIEVSSKFDELPEVFAEVNFGKLIQNLGDLKKQIPDKKQHKKIHRQFAQNLINFWLKTFHLTPELVNISEEELKEMDQQYFYICWLMLQCKDSAVRVSRDVWQEIEKGMFLP